MQHFQHISSCTMGTSQERTQKQNVASYAGQYTKQNMAAVRAKLCRFKNPSPGKATKSMIPTNTPAKKPNE